MTERDLKEQVVRNMIEKTKQQEFDCLMERVYLDLLDDKEYNAIENEISELIGDNQSLVRLTEDFKLDKESYSIDEMKSIARYLFLINERTDIEFKKVYEFGLSDAFHFYESVLKK